MAYCSKELSLKIMRANRCLGIFGVSAMFTGMLAAFSPFLFSQITDLLLRLFIIFSVSTAVSAWLVKDWLDQAELEKVVLCEKKSLSETVPAPAKKRKHIYLDDNGKVVKKEIRGVYGQKEN